MIAERPNGRVYLTEDNAGCRIVLKELVFAAVPDIQVLESFEREGEILKQLDHPAIPRFVSTFREGTGVSTRLYLAQEYVAGESLLQLLARKRFSEDEALAIARDVLSTLSYLHSRSPQVIHRDLKPANLIARADGSIALVDFGAARDLFGGHTHGATLVGTLGYMPPEQLGGTVNATCDLYSLGATLIHLLSRKPPWELLRSDMTLDFEGWVNLSPRTVEFLKRLVERDPEKRYPTAADALAAIDQSIVPPVDHTAGFGEPHPLLTPRSRWAFLSLGLYPAVGTGILATSHFGNGWGVAGGLAAAMIGFTAAELRAPSLKSRLQAALVRLGIAVAAGAIPFRALADWFGH